MFRFENLEVWKLTRKFVVKVYRITQLFPPEERYGLTNQIRRAVVSIILNIAEGSDRKSDLDFRRFLKASLTSAEEVVTGFYIALDLKYVNQADFDEIYSDANLIVAKINSLINSLSKK